ncbi:MAG: SH3 domain-containing protein, partial [Enterocloster sp.]|nr:SH3 domain-containing protein [Enterocloster sp.]
MKVKKYKRGLAVMLGLALAVQLPGAVPFHPMDTYAYTGAATVKASSLNVRSGAGTGYQAIGRLAAGASIQVLGEQRGTDGKTWYQIRFSGTGGTEQTGYVSAEYVRLPVSYTTDSDFEAKLSAEGFPESYKNGLRQLHAQYPNWVFKAKKTGLDWNTVIENEALLGRNLVSSGSISSWKSVESGAYNWDNSTWT